jgi:drug/metabolite transporter (DMT)-like permease
LFSAACFGALPIFAKLAYADGVSPATLLLLRFSVAAVLLVGVLVVRPGLRAVTAHEGTARTGRISRRLVITALGLGALGYATQSSLYFSALDRIAAPMVALVLYTYPVLVTLAAVLLGRDRLTPRRAAALLASSAGTLLVLLGAGGVGFDVIGVALAFGAAVTYTVYILVADTVVHRLPPVVLSALVMTGGATALAARALVTGELPLGFGVAGWFWVTCVAVVSTVVAMLAFFAGLRRIGPSATAILSTFEPVVTTVLAASVLQEFLTPVQLVGGAVVLCSVAILQLRSRFAGRPLCRTPSRGRPGPHGRASSDPHASLTLRR